MKNILILFLLFSLSITSFAQTVKSKDVAQIMQTFQNQQKAWNNGDLEGFMNGYWQSDSLKFIGKNEITYGYEATLNRYKKSYPDTATMGKLQFDILSFKKLDKKHVFVIGKWHLKRDEKEDLEGHFTLIWEKINKKWVIIADHSS
ncbi:nuclear transport factor 2 family protein [Bernardetia sp. Wsw4-3y2]|uniref:YybH family protein n=1 Tax=Bernardetia sp. Wsw4-3y2 TaxID=3127471 RepID=UPI0030CF75FA